MLLVRGAAEKNSLLGCDDLIDLVGVQSIGSLKHGRDRHDRAPASRFRSPIAQQRIGAAAVTADEP
jgi:hypothetical protein